MTYSALRRSGLRLEDAVIPELTKEEVETALKRWSPFGLNDYVIFTADKPQSDDA